MNASPTRRPFAFDRRWLLLAALILLVAGAAGGLLVTRRGASAPAPEEATIWQAITADITEAQVPKQVALEAFAYLYRVVIPGVQVPAGLEGGDGPTSGTGVTRWVQAHWAELTPAQQAVINRYITVGPNDVVIHIDATTEAAPKLLELAGAGHPVGVLVSNNPLEDAMRAELLADIKHLGPKLGVPLILPGGISSWQDVTFVLSNEDGGGTLMTTVESTNFGGHYSPCNIIAYKNAWANEPFNGGKVSDTLHVLMTHEVIHCFQNVIWGSPATQKSIPPWITEGSALWLAADDTHIAEPMIPSMWLGYFKSELALTNRSYDAFGYYALLDHQGRNLWGLMAPAWKAAAASTTNRSNPFIAVLDGDASDVRDAWAPSYLRRQDWLDPWIAYGFGLTDTAQVVPHLIEATSAGWPGTLQSRSNSVAQVQRSDGEVVAVETTGLLSAHDESTDMVLRSQSERFCTVDSCVCKPGTLRAGEDMAEQHMRLPFDLAFNAPEGGSSYVVTGLRLDDLCGKKASPPPPPPGAARPPCAIQVCAGDNGDPHLVTVDQHRYDFQAAGEFTLLRSADGSLEIQGRQEPWQPSDHLSVNTAIAAKVGSRRVGVYLTGGGLELHVDGVVTAVTSPIDLGSGGRVVAYPKGYEIDFPDGTTLWTLSLGRWGINAQIRPSAALHKGGVGILGPVLPGGLDVPSLPGGGRLPRATDSHAAYVELYQTLATAWRVTDSTSLFDYAPGSSTATFTKSSFPAEASALTLAQLPTDQQAAAQQQCAPITDPDLRDECAFDVAVTGQNGFGDLYQLTQGFLQQGPQSLGSTQPPTESAPPTEGPLPVGITQLLPLVDNLDGATLAPDGTLYLSVEAPNNASLVMAVNPQQGRIERQVTASGAGLVVFASGSVWVGETTDVGVCNIVRMDAISLVVQATIAVPCVFGHPAFASLGQAIWFIDESAMDGDLNGAVLRMIDPATNMPTTTTAALPYGNGYLSSGAGSTSIVYGDNAKDVLLLPVGATHFQSLGKLQVPLYGATNGAWTWTNGNGTATLIGPSGVLATVPVDGAVVGADDHAVYVSGHPAPDGSDTLWRYPADGSAPVQLAQGARVGTADNATDLGYFDNWPFLVGQHAAVKIWLPFSATDHLHHALDLQWVALP